LLPQWREASQAFDRLWRMLACQSMPLQPANIGAAMTRTIRMRDNRAMGQGNGNILVAIWGIFRRSS